MKLRGFLILRCNINSVVGGSLSQGRKPFNHHMVVPSVTRSSLCLRPLLSSTIGTFSAHRFKCVMASNNVPYEPDFFAEQRLVFCEIEF